LMPDCNCADAVAVVIANAIIKNSFFIVYLIILFN
jgi:hypothetical protein